MVQRKLFYEMIIMYMLSVQLYYTVCIRKHHFFQVNVQVSNKSALHCAVAANTLDVLKVVLEFKPYLEIKVP